MIKKTEAITFAVVALSTLLSVPAFAQQCNLAGSPMSTLRTPLIEGQPNTPAGLVAPEGQPPAIGHGPIPVGVHPGMGGPPTHIPSNPITPDNNIEYPSYYIPHNEATESAPGVLGPNTWAPPPPSTPGWDPGIVHAPINFYPPPVAVVPINPGGGIYGGAPMQRWGGQTTRDFGRYKHQGTRKYDFGIEAWGSTSQDGPWQTRPGAVPTQDLYGRRFPLRNGMPTQQTIAPL